jgi:hypothetical protein
MKSGRISGSNSKEIKTIETTGLINQLQCELSIIHTIDFDDMYVPNINTTESLRRKLNTVNNNLI